jgi:hypothetical protein
MVLFFDGSSSPSLVQGIVPNSCQITSIQSLDIPLTTSSLPTRFSANQLDSTANSLVVIDSGVHEYERLANGVLPEGDVLILDPLRDGLSQISEALHQRQGISSLHVISHGGPGYLQLGNSVVDFDLLLGRNSEVQLWASALTSDADILLYGCDVATGEQGLQFVQELSSLTEADVAASADLTGDFSQGGNWTLEYATGNIEASTPFTDSSLSSYQGLLATLLGAALLERRD